MWKHPKSLLQRGLSAPPSIPLNAGIVQGHLLCASEEFPLCGSHAITELLNGEAANFHLVDHDLFGSEDVYRYVVLGTSICFVYSYTVDLRTHPVSPRDALENLCDSKQVQPERVNDLNKFKTYSKHPVSFSICSIRIQFSTHLLIAFAFFLCSLLTSPAFELVCAQLNQSITQLWISATVNRLIETIASMIKVRLWIRYHIQGETTHLPREATLCTNHSHYIIE